MHDERATTNTTTIEKIPHATNRSGHLPQRKPHTRRGGAKKTERTRWHGHPKPRPWKPLAPGLAFADADETHAEGTSGKTRGGGEYLPAVKGAAQYLGSHPVYKHGMRARTLAQTATYGLQAVYAVTQRAYAQCHSTCVRVECMMHVPME